MNQWTPSRHAQEITAWRRTRQYRAIVIAAVASIACVILLGFFLAYAPGWPRTRDSFFSAHYGFEATPFILRGVIVNIELMLICGIASFICGLILAVIRVTHTPAMFPIRALATIYVDIFRGLPVILLIYMLGFGAPSLNIPGIPLNPLVWGVAALVLSYSAYTSEVIRAGILSVHPAQWDAGRCLGLSYRQILISVIIPQAIRAVIPALVNNIVSLEKDSGLIAVLGVVDAIRAAGIIAGEKFNYTPYVVAGVLFLVLSIPLTRLTDYLLAQDRRKRYG